MNKLLLVSIIIIIIIITIWLINKNKKPKSKGCRENCKESCSDFPVLSPDHDICITKCELDCSSRQDL